MSHIRLKNPVVNKKAMKLKDRKQAKELCHLLKKVHIQNQVWFSRKFYFFTKQERRLKKQLRQLAGG